MAESRRTITGTTTTTRDRLSARSKRIPSRGQGFSTGDASAGFLSTVTASAWGDPSLTLPREVASFPSCGASAMPHWTPSLPPGTSIRPGPLAQPRERVREVVRIHRRLDLASEDEPVILPQHPGGYLRLSLANAVQPGPGHHLRVSASGRRDARCHPR